MDIFKDARSKVIFAYALAAHPGESGADNMRAVRQALAAAGVEHELHSPAMCAMLRDYAQQILAVVHAQLLPEKAAVLLARYSRDWPTRRTACVLLRSHFQSKVERLLNNPAALEKLVQLHFIVERDRAGDWDVAKIAADHQASLHAVRDARAVMVLYAEQLERAALEAVEFGLQREVAHA